MEQEWPRRRFMRSAATIAGAVVVGPSVLAACGDDSKDASNTTTTGGSGGGGGGDTSTTSTSTGTSTEEPNAFRLSARHSKGACNACIAHARNRYYASREDADGNRAHEGCNCQVRGQAIPDADAKKYFANGTTVFDKRNG